MAKRRGKAGSLGSFFRNFYAENPDQLKEKKNDKPVAAYRQANGLVGDAPVERRIMQNLANVKSILRKRGRKRGPKAAGEKAGERPVRAARNLEALEIMIDEAMMLARVIDREGLENVWRHLRAARNQVVLRMGE